jgi:hypothetical protein
MVSGLGRNQGQKVENQNLKVEKSLKTQVSCVKMKNQIPSV